MQQEIISLSNWTRSFAEYTGFLVANPPLEQVRSAIATLPNQLLRTDIVNLDVEQILEDALGIAAIVQIGTEKIAWRTVSDGRRANRLRHRTEAEVLQIAYSSTEYSRARHKLGIDVHWLLLVNLELLEVYTPGSLYEAHLAAYDEAEDRPECVIVSL